MSDNLLYRVPTTGTVATFGTDEVGSIHYQYVKLMDGTNGSTTPIEGSSYGLEVDLKRFPTEQIDAFSRIRTSNPGYRFDDQFTYGIGSQMWDTSLSSGSTATHSSTERWVALTTNSGGTHNAILQSHYHSPYTPGRSQLAFCTFLFGSTPGSGAARRVGYFDGTNGVYLEQTSSAVNLVLKSGTTTGTQTVAQANWNIDKLDGTGASGLTLDLTKVQILVVSMQALYVGRVIVGFDIGGKLIPVHQFVHANEASNASYPYIQQASLPVRFEASTTSSAVTMYAICASVISEGGEDLQNMPGRSWSYGTGAASTGVTTRRPVLSIRANQQMNSINSDVIIVPTDIVLLARSNDAYVEIVRNGTLSGGTPTWTNADATFSAVSYNTDSTGISGGRVVDSFYVAASASTKADIQRQIMDKLVLCYSHLTSTADVLSIVVTARTGTTDIHPAITWKEIR